MNRPSVYADHIWQRPLILALLMILLSPQFTKAQAGGFAAGDGTLAVATPDWLEPRGLNVVDLVGLVPEAHLQDAVVAYNGAGILQYLSGSREGRKVTVRVRAFPQYWNGSTHISCLGQTASHDEWPSPVPASAARIYAGERDITSSVTYLEYWSTGQIKPERNPTQNPAQRYAKQANGNPSFTNDGRVEIPANSGCILSLSGEHENVTATFTFQSESVIAVETLGSQAFSFKSYIGPGGAGYLDSLRNQMQARWPGIRHDKFGLDIPVDADYVLVTYPPNPVTVNPWTEVAKNLPQPSGGTYRLARNANNVLSVDHIHTAGLPIHGQWQDADQAAGTTFLPFFADATILASPEYFLPAGFSYDPCMTNGGCSEDLLKRIYEATMSMEIHYYRIMRTGVGLDRIPLKQVGPAWSAGRSGAVGPIAERLVSGRTANAATVYLPLIGKAQPPPEPDDPTGCPCGWFDNLGRMLDYIPPQ